MTSLAAFVRHTRNYSIASLLSVAAGLISFPLLTRILSIEDYGLMSLVASSLTFAAALGKLGMQRSTLRFYSEVHQGNFVGAEPRHFTPTVFYSMSCLGALATLGWLAAAIWTPTSFWSQERMSYLMLLTAPLVWVRVQDSTLSNLLSAQERSGLLAKLIIARRYLLLCATLATVLWVTPNVIGFYVATVVVECLSIFWALRLAFLRQWPRWSERSVPLLKAMLVFSVPMAGYELASIFIQMGDRYVLQSLLDMEAVGLYSASHNLANQLQGVVFSAMTVAAVPMCIRLAETEGRPAMADFVRRITHTYLLVALLVVCLFASIRVELIALLASHKYAPAADAAPLILLGMLCDSYLGIAGMGLYLAKRTVVSMLILVSGALLSLGINLVLVPRLGIEGSALANLLSVALVLSMLLTAGRASLPPGVFFAPLLRLAPVALLAFLAAEWIHTPWLLVNLVLRGGVAALVFATLVLILDSRARELAAPLARRLRLKERQA